MLSCPANARLGVFVRSGAPARVDRSLGYGSVLEDVDNEVIDGLDGLLSGPGPGSRGLSAVSTVGVVEVSDAGDTPDQGKQEWS